MVLTSSVNSGLPVAHVIVLAGCSCWCVVSANVVVRSITCFKVSVFSQDAAVSSANALPIASGISIFRALAHICTIMFSITTESGQPCNRPLVLLHFLPKPCPFLNRLNTVWFISWVGFLILSLISIVSARYVTNCHGIWS